MQARTRGANSPGPVMKIMLPIRMALTVLVWAATMCGVAPAQPQRSAPAPASSEEQVREFTRLLAEPSVRAWIERSARMAEPSPPQDIAAAEPSLGDLLDRRLQALHDHVGAISAAVRNLPSDVAAAIANLDPASGYRGILQTLLLIALLVTAGLVAEIAAARALALVRSRDATASSANFEKSPRAILRRATIVALRLAAFTIASIGMLIALGIPQPQRQVAVLFVAATAIIRAATLLLGLLLAPHAAPLRILPTTDDRARFWYRHLLAWVAWLAAGYAGVAALGRLGLPMPTRMAIAYGLGTGLLATALATVWQLRRLRGPPARGAAPAALAIGFIALWLLWLSNSMAMFWPLAVALALPPLLRTTRSIVRNVLCAAPDEGENPPTTVAVLVERALRAAWLTAAAATIGWSWGIDQSVFARNDSTLSRLAAGAISAAVILLFADLLWQLAKTSIDEKIRRAYTGATAAPSSIEASRRQARLRTLLPILRNLLGILVLTMATLMALSALGVQVGPLLAGAGVVGVAIGFGSQTIVRDIIAGAFYLLDDAFRVGEYIQSGNYKGTVESFSLRSVRLRHHRGPLYTVPFGVLGAVQNMSRDWVIDKIVVSIAYDSDLAKVKKVVKEVSKEIAADPELARMIIEPLKSQGIAALGDYGIDLRLKVKTLPGDQFIVRRTVYERIVKAFDAAGIKFAVPTVAVSSHVEERAAAAAGFVSASREAVHP